MSAASRNSLGEPNTIGFECGIYKILPTTRGTYLALSLASPGRRDTIKHFAPLVTLVSGFLGGWFVPGDRLPSQEVHAQTIASATSFADGVPLQPVQSPVRTALPDVAPPKGESTSLTNDPQSLAAEAFSREVLRLSADADRLDGLWQLYKTECMVAVNRQYDFGREWFALWDGDVRSTVSTPECNDVPLTVVDAAETIRHDLVRARAVAQETGVGLGTEVGVLRWHTLEGPMGRR